MCPDEISAVLLNLFGVFISGKQDLAFANENALVQETTGKVSGIASEKTLLQACMLPLCS